ncbi:tRNA (guanosine(37)-N1)-methyltransferase TrmD [Candidatus Kapabacteria bacterium]|nr:tRNA (guanosine(37)-N1)-methyltransferase TrmD [Candidatus Kapabacteria bacterium]
MRIDILSVVPKSMESHLQSSIIEKAIKKGIAEVHLHDLHDYSSDKHKKVDDYLYGGNSGMLLKCEPVFTCIEKLKSERTYDEIIYVSADGEKYNQSTANKLSLMKNIIILAGHYKGIDQRIRDVLITQEISIGDYVLTGGELPALVITDSIIRLLPGSIGDSTAALSDSFQSGLLDSPQYTRPEIFREYKVPEVLLSGHHKNIEKWIEVQSYEKTKRLRPDLLENE